MKDVSTSCKALGHSPEATKFARRNCSTLVDHFGLNSLFPKISPCDECSFRFQLFANPNKHVSTEDRPCIQKNNCILSNYLMYFTIFASHSHHAFHFHIVLTAYTD